MADEVAKQKTTPKPDKKEDKPKPRSNGLIEFVDYLLTLVGEIAILTGRSVRSFLRYGVHPGDLLRQMAAIGVDSVWIVAIISAASGSVFALYTAKLAVNIGATVFVGGTLGYAYLNELGPVLGGVAFAARSGAAIAAEIGTMVVTEQVDALRAMAVSPTRYLVIPRVLAATLMLPALTLIGDIVGLFSGYISAGMNGISGADFIESLFSYTRPSDLTNGLIKAVVFGYLVGMTACQQGLRTEGGATGVGHSTTRSVVLCVMLISLSDVVLAVLLQGRR